MDSLLCDWHTAQDGIDPDRPIEQEDWVQIDPAYDCPTSFRHHAYKNFDLHASTDAQSLVRTRQAVPLYGTAD